MKQTIELIDDSILIEIAHGKETAFAKLFHCYRDKVYAVALKLTKSEFRAEEVVQDVFLKLWIKKEKLPEITDIESYIFVMTRNVVYDAMKNMISFISIEDTFDITASSATADSALYTNEIKTIIAEALTRLSPQQREIYKLSKEQELKRDEVADLLKISSESVKTQLARAVRSIRAYTSSRLGLISSLLIFLH